MDHHLRHLESNTHQVSDLESSVLQLLSGKVGSYFASYDFEFDLNQFIPVNCLDFAQLVVLRSLECC